MTTKGFADNNTNIETPNDVGVSEKPLKNHKIVKFFQLKKWQSDIYSDH